MKLPHCFSEGKPMVLRDGRGWIIRDKSPLRFDRA